jgi:F0F1-type ATP synthase assembly protein I
MQCQYDKNNMQCFQDADSSQNYCKKHRITVKEETSTGIIGGTAIGALLVASPIGMIAGAVIGGVYAYNIHKHKQNKSKY